MGRHLAAPGLFAAWFAAVTLTLSGCDALTPERPNLMVEPDVERPEPSVDLPPVPPLELLDLPRQYGDGSWSITGLLLHRETLRQTDVRLTGVVQELYVCERPSVADEDDAGSVGEDADVLPTRDTVTPGCLRPHLFIADSMQSTRRLLVTGYLALHWEPQLSVGQRVVVVGRYAQEARGFISTEEGLVIADGFEGEGLEPLPVADAGEVADNE